MRAPVMARRRPASTAREPGLRRRRPPSVRGGRGKSASVTFVEGRTSPAGVARRGGTLARVTGRVTELQRAACSRRQPRDASELRPRPGRARFASTATEAPDTLDRTPHASTGAKASLSPLARAPRAPRNPCRSCRGSDDPHWTMRAAGDAPPFGAAARVHPPPGAMPRRRGSRTVVRESRRPDPPRAFHRPARGSPSGSAAPSRDRTSPWP